MALVASIVDDTPGATDGAALTPTTATVVAPAIASAQTVAIETSAQVAAEEPRGKKRTPSVLGSLFRRKEKPVASEKVEKGGKRVSRRDQTATTDTASDEGPAARAARASAPVLVPAVSVQRTRVTQSHSLGGSPDSGPPSASSTADGSVAASPESGAVTPTRVASGFHVADANTLHVTSWPEPQPNDAVYRLAQTAVQVAHEAARSMLAGAFCVHSDRVCSK